MKILHVISSVDPRGGGPVEGIRQRGLYLQAQGHQVEVLSLDEPDAAHVSAFPLPVHAVGGSLGRYAWAPGLKPWLLRHAAGYDAVVVSGMWQYHGWATSQVLRRLGLPYHVFTHGMLDPWFKHAYRLKHFKKWIYWLLAEYHVLKHAKAVLFTTEEERLRARESFSLYSANEAVVDYGTSAPPTGGEALAQAFMAEHPHLTGKHLVLFLGRIHEKKGCDLLIQAFAEVADQHPALHLVMAGPAAPPLAQSLRDLASRLAVSDRITWLGMVTGDRKWGVAHACDVFILPSHQENFGIAVAEALACGLPVLISDKVNIWREVVADKAGLVAPDTASGTADMLKRWLAFTPRERAAMRAQASATFEQRYTVAASGKSLVRNLQSAREDSASGTKPLSILHVVSSVDPALGGVAESIRARGVKLVEMGHRVEVVSLDDPNAAFVSAYPLTLHPLGRGHTRWQYHSRLSSWIKSQSHRFDAVVVDGLWQYHGLATRRALAGTGVPYFVFPHGMLDPWFKRTYPFKHLKKWLFWPWAEYRVLRDASAVLFTCEEERRVARESFWLYRVNEKIAPLGTAEPPVDGDALSAKFLAEYPQLRDQQSFLFLGRLHPKKGCDLLLEAFAAVASSRPTLRLTMAGPGEEHYLAKLQKQAQDLGIAAQVTWLGMVRGDMKWGALYASKAFVLPSHQENFGIAVVEALACAKPVLISNKVSIWHEVAQDKAGLVGPDTVDGTRQTFSRWLALDPIERTGMSERARGAYLSRYTVEASAAGLLTAMALR